jgi:cbb3-type cytochrome oxidase subunit 3
MHNFHAVISWVQLHAVIAMIVVFGLIIISSYWPSRRAAIERNGMIPLRDDM